MLKGHQSWIFDSKPTILASAAVGGPFEGNGALADDFDIIYEDLWLGQDSYEKAERAMLEHACQRAIEKSHLQKEDINFFLSGDLMNQIISSSFTARTLGSLSWYIRCLLKFYGKFITSSPINRYQSS